MQAIPSTCSKQEEKCEDGFLVRPAWLEKKGKHKRKKTQKESKEGFAKAG